jgi:hypothetical protein
MVAAAVCPQPPAIVPELAAGAAPELDDLRAACDAAVAHLIAAEPDLIVAVGGGPRAERFDAGYRGSFAPWGVAVEVAAPVEVARSAAPAAPHRTGPTTSAMPPRLPLSLLVAAWLLARQPPQRHRLAAVAADAPAPINAGTGAELAGTPQRLALLVLGDGSACRGTAAPGYDDPRAEAFDRTVAAALADADTRTLLGLDQALSDELRVAGRAPWQVLAGAAAASGGGFTGHLRYHRAPYGVAYLVATWSPA